MKNNKRFIKSQKESLSNESFDSNDIDIFSNISGISNVQSTINKNNQWT